jgi:hypothetical protein
MSKAQPTQGRLVHNTNGYPQADIKSESGRNVAITWGLAPFKSNEHQKRRTAEDRENARRLVACWNACLGMSIESLESMPGHYFGAVMAERRLTAEQQREELLAAIEQAINSEDGVSGRTADQILRQARDKVLGD